MNRERLIIIARSSGRVTDDRTLRKTADQLARLRNQGLITEDAEVPFIYPVIFLPASFLLSYPLFAAT